MLDFCAGGYPNLLLIAPVDIDPGNSRSGGPEMRNAPPTGFVAATADPATIRRACPRGGDQRPPAPIRPGSAELGLAGRGSRARDFHGYETVRWLFVDEFRRCDQRRIPGSRARQAAGRLAGLADISGCQIDQFRGAVMQWKKVHTQTTLLLLTSADAFIICDVRAGLPQQEYASAEPAPAVTPAAGGARPRLPRPAARPLPELCSTSGDHVMTSPRIAPATACHRGLRQRQRAGRPRGGGALTAALAGHRTCVAP